MARYSRVALYRTQNLAHDKHGTLSPVAMKKLKKIQKPQITAIPEAHEEILKHPLPPFPVLENQPSEQSTKAMRPTTEQPASVSTKTSIKRAKSAKKKAKKVASTRQAKGSARKKTATVKVAKKIKKAAPKKNAVKKAASKKLTRKPVTKKNNT